jgi:hypothetical protein
MSTIGGLVWTDLRGDHRTALVAEHGEDTVVNMERLRKSILAPTAPPEVYLCHGYCELGAIKAVDAFSSIRRFLERNPSEVVVVIVQDSTTADDTTAALRAAGLDEFAYAHQVGEAWPTLGELIRNATPLVVLAENHGGSPEWFHPAFDSIQDTAFNVRSVDQLTCDPNRGSGDASLFLLNHWIHGAPPRSEDALTINARSFLTDRVRACEKERGQRVNIVAVNFWRSGELVAAIDELNGLRKGPM